MEQLCVRACDEGRPGTGLRQEYEHTGGEYM